MGDPAALAALVVEDDPPIRRLVAMVLSREGFRVETANDGLEAVSKLDLTVFDVIVLDLMMPRLDGFALVRTLAANDPDLLRRIIITSAASPGVIAERMQGMNLELLPKPFDIQELAARVRSCASALAES